MIAGYGSPRSMGVEINQNRRCFNTMGMNSPPLLYAWKDAYHFQDLGARRHRVAVLRMLLHQSNIERFRPGVVS